MFKGTLLLPWAYQHEHFNNPKYLYPKLTFIVSNAKTNFKSTKLIVFAPNIGIRPKMYTQTPRLYPTILSVAFQPIQITNIDIIWVFVCKKGAYG